MNWNKPQGLVAVVSYLDCDYSKMYGYAITRLILEKFWLPSRRYMKSSGTVLAVAHLRNLGLTVRRQSPKVQCLCPSLFTATAMWMTQTNELTDKVMVSLSSLSSFLKEPFHCPYSNIRQV